MQYLRHAHIQSDENTDSSVHTYASVLTKVINNKIIHLVFFVSNTNYVRPVETLALFESFCAPTSPLTSRA